MAQDASRLFVTTYADFVWRCVRRFGVSEASAPDAAQQVFLVALAKLDSLEAGKEKAFLFATASNVAAHVRRSFARRREEAWDATESTETADHAPNPESALADQQARRVLDELLARLPNELREVLILCEIEEMTMAEVAEVLSIPPGTVASRLRRARAAFEELAATKEEATR